MPARPIANLADLTEGTTAKFSYKKEGIRREGFVASVGGVVVAYENLCKHIPVSLDYGDGQFFTGDRKHFICQTHGAMYEPLTGVCVRGPCAGASLNPLPFQILDGKVWFEDE